MKLHLGCGKRYLEGYVHIDINDFEHIDYKISVENLSVINDESCELIYASHVLEYFDLEEVSNVLSEWKRKLKKEGILRLSVPNLKSLVEIYNQTKDISNIIGPLYGKWESGEDKIYHRTIYDQKLLTNILKENGFTNIKKWDWEKELPQGYDDHSISYFPHMDTENGIHVSLNIECQKL